MAKIELDKYYTNIHLAKHCIDKTVEIIGVDNITEYLEPSAGNGSFSNQLENCLAYDIEPENANITKQDYLTLDLKYKKGRCIIGNPPFGKSNNLSVKFFKKSILLGDYVSFILPISQLDSQQYMYEFDLIHSEDLGKVEYSDRNLHCCLNIYKRPFYGINKTKPNYILNDVSITNVNRSANRNDKIPFGYNLSVCGLGSIGKICEYENQYAKQLYIVINNKKYENEIIDLIEKTDWNKLYPSISTPSLTQWRILKHIKDNIKDIS